MYARAHGIAFDDELYYVSALLHDAGLTELFDSHSLPFEEAGGNLAWVFGVAAGWPEARAARVEHIIVTHMRADVSAAEDAESHLLQVATPGTWQDDVLKNSPRTAGKACSTGTPDSTSPRSSWPRSRTRRNASRPVRQHRQSNPADASGSSRIRSTPRPCFIGGSK